MDSTKRFIQHLIEIKERKGFTDQQMSDRLGCSRQLFQKTRTRKVPLGDTILKGILRAFPELKGDAYIFLTTDAKELAIVPNNLTIPHETHQNGFLRALRAFREVLYTGLKKRNK